MKSEYLFQALSSTEIITMLVVLSTLLLYTLRTIVMHCYQMICKDDEIIGTNESISISNDLNDDEIDGETEVFPIFSCIGIKIITISENESEAD